MTFTNYLLHPVREVQVPESTSGVSVVRQELGGGVQQERGQQQEFPTPINISDMQSYWALVNQVFPFYSMQPHLQPFWELLKKKSTWYWDRVLQKLFEDSRKHITSR
jgi:hypothetical protein